MRSAEELTIVVIGASGDLARRKIFPALFALYCQDLLPERFHVMGFARTRMTEAEFRDRVVEKLTCRYVPNQSCDARMAEFLARCHYVAGNYDSRDAYLDLFTAMREVEQGREVNRMYYLAIPPSIFMDVANSLAGAGLVNCGMTQPWSRVVIEKPFGRDRQSSDLLTRELSNVFSEGGTYRIDHYLGKEVIQNLLVLRFANLIFEPIWNRRFIRGVQIAWREDLGVEGRGGYFDSYGIIRDVVQNHLLQILALVAMEPPARLDGHAIRDAKVRLLRQTKPVANGDVVVGQYVAGEYRGRAYPAYVDDPTVPDGSITPTYMSAVLSVENDRWRDTPFLLSAGKGLNGQATEIRILFREAAGAVFCDAAGCPSANELVIRVQPDESIRFRIMNKIPGIGMRLAARDLDLRYTEAFADAIIPDAYESLILDVIRGEKGLFIRSDELAASWDIFTPLLHWLERERVLPDPYAFGGDGPAAAAALAARVGLPVASSRGGVDR